MWKIRQKIAWKREKIKSRKKWNVNINAAYYRMFKCTDYNTLIKGLESKDGLKNEKKEKTKT